MDGSKGRNETTEGDGMNFELTVVIVYLVAVFAILFVVVQDDTATRKAMIEKCSPNYNTFECQLYLSRRQYIYVHN